MRIVLKISIIIIYFEFVEGIIDINFLLYNFIIQSYREGGNISEGKLNKGLFKRVITKQVELLDHKMKDLDSVYDAIFESYYKFYNNFL